MVRGRAHRGLLLAPLLALTGLLGFGAASASAVTVSGVSAVPANTAAGFAPRPAYRPLTKFENRGLRLGHGVWDIIFKKL